MEKDFFFKLGFVEIAFLKALQQTGDIVEVE